MSSFFKNVTFTFITRVLAAILSALATILISRAFGPAGKGIFTMVAFIPGLALNLGHLGLGNANTYLISQDKEKTKQSFYNSFWYGLIIGSLFVIIFALLYRLFPQELFGKGNIGSRFFLLSLATIPFILWENFYQGIFVGRQEFKFFNLINLISKILLCVGLIILAFFLKVDLRWSVIYYLCLMVLPATVYTFYFLIHCGLPLSFDKSLFSQALNFGLRSYLSCILAYLILRSDIYFVNMFRGLEEVGLYSLATNFADAILLIVSSITLVLFPKITENQEEGLETTLKVTRIVSLIIGSIVILGFIFGGWLIPLVFGKNFSAALPAFYILLPATYFWAITNLLTQFFASKGYPWFTVWIWLPGLVLNIILNIIYIPKYGMVAAALTSLIAYLLSLVLHYIYLQRYTKVSFSKISIPKIKEILNHLKKNKILCYGNKAKF